MSKVLTEKFGNVLTKSKRCPYGRLYSLDKQNKYPSNSLPVAYDHTTMNTPVLV